MEGSNVVFPAEMTYPIPSSLPKGIVGTASRIQNMNTIPGSGGGQTPASSEIIIQIPEQPSCFLDTSSTRLYVEATYVATFTIQNFVSNPTTNSIMYMAPSNANGGFIGGGASLFQRYQLYLNNSILSDDITEFGMVCYLMYLMNYTEDQRFRMANVLGLNKGFPGGVWGAAFHGTNMQDRATFTATGIVGSISNPVLPYNSAAGNGIGNSGGTALAFPTQYNQPSGVFWVSNGTAAQGYPQVVLTATQNFNFLLHLPGLLGGGMKQMLPLFVGPYKISLFMDSLQNYWALDFGQGSVNQLYPQYVPTTSTMSVNSVWVEYDYYRCDVPSFNVIMSSLPTPNTFVLRSTAFTVSSYLIPAGAQGQNDFLIPPRKASIKCVYICSTPGFAKNPTIQVPQAGQSVTTNYAGYQCNPWGKYGWVNPNLGINTCILLNGYQYPQQGNNPMDRPVEAWYNLLNANKTWSDTFTKPGIAPSNFLVCDSISSVWLSAGLETAGGFNNPAWYSYAKATNNTNSGRSLWRILPTNTTRFSIPRYTIASNTSNPWAGGTFICGITGANANSDNIVGGFAAPDSTGATTADINDATSMTDKTVNLSGDREQSLFGFFLDGSSSCDNMPNSFFGTSNYHLNFQQDKPSALQHIYACNLDQLSKANVMTGMASLTGSFFWRTNIVDPLLLPYTAYFIIVYDQVIVLDSAIKLATVRF